MILPNKITKTELILYRREIVDAQKWHFFYQIGWEPHRYQIRCHLSKARNRYSCAGRRGGKSEWAGKEAAAYMVAGPFKVCLVGPTYDDVKKEFDVIKKAILHPANPHEIVRLVDNKQAGTLFIELSNGAECEGRSAANPTRSKIVGDEYDLIILCEGALINNLGGEGGIWETQLRGNLTTRRGDLIVPTTPAGKDNFLYPRFTSALTGNNPDEFAIQWPAWANPMYFEDPVEMFRSMSWRAFQEQVLGLFVSWAGAIWTTDCGFDTEVHVIPPFTVPNWYRRIEVIDPGFSGNFAWLAIVVDENGTIFVVDSFQVPRTRYKDLAALIVRRRAGMYGGSPPPNIPVYVDPADPRARMEISEAAMEIGERIYCLPANNNVWSGFEKGSALLRSNQLFITNNNTALIESLLNHEWGGETTKGKKEAQDEYKHFSDCMRYGLLTNLMKSDIPVEPMVSGRMTGADLLNLNNGGLAVGFGLDFYNWQRLLRGEPVLPRGSYNAFGQREGQAIGKGIAREMAKPVQGDYLEAVTTGRELAELGKLDGRQSLAKSKITGWNKPI